MDQVWNTARPVWGSTQGTMVHVLVGVGGVGLLLALLATGGARSEAVNSAALSRADREFLARHWRRPIPPQGPAPDGFTPLERSLSPENCGACHPAQLADWSTSLHAKSMGAGVMGQLAEMKRTDPDDARSCLTCHAPLAEQSEQIEGPRGPAANPDFDAGLQRQGLVCAACHVRRHERFGPPAWSPTPTGRSRRDCRTTARPGPRPISGRSSARAATSSSRRISG